ncbi:hypothetical protein GFB49_05860 [Epibacterium sp. SM1979]|uniref:APC family permease n=1 Tax=Tritonibacter litoralis TaxID=2662264 RepID=A0A843YFB6_9RHOB|nr:hypothetical protein [Tritonibacter litoralis]MQQ07972.1 hypothetical protein [Tritonibacter litoralis]
MLLNILIISVTVLCGTLLMWPRLAHAPLWRATITPLASIIGSGFLVLGPILNASFGGWAPVVMAVLCAVAAGFGQVMVFNIRWLDRAPPPGRIDRALEAASAWALAFAYFVSVAYYLNLLGAFAVTLTDSNDGFHARLVTSGVFAVILLVGWTRGFGALERLEQISVGVKLSIIAGLLFALIWAFGERLNTGALVWAPPSQTGWSALALGFGLLVTVQGFETARYLGETYDAGIRVRALRLAQILSTAIYMIYIFCLTFIFAPDSMALEETAIISLMAAVAPILPMLLIAAALSAQFSAAVADTAGSGGLVTELTRNRLPPAAVYALLTGFGLWLTWRSDVFEIITYASRAFAAFYGLQAVLAAHRARLAGQQASARLFGALALLGLAMVIFGTPVE